MLFLTQNLECSFCLAKLSQGSAVFIDLKSSVMNSFIFVDGLIDSVSCLFVLQRLQDAKFCI